jgi:protease PrsW
MNALILLALATAPGFAIMLFIYFRDKYEKEPFKILLFTFLFGLITIIPPIIIELIGESMGLSNPHHELTLLVYVFLFVGFSEEYSKFLVLRIYSFRRKAFNEPFDGIVYAVMVSMAFATTENIFYVADGGIKVGLIRMFTAVPMHAVCAVLMGYFVGRAKFSNHRFLLNSVGVILATLVHGTYDYFLFLKDYPVLAVLAFVVLIIAVLLSLLAIRSGRRLSPFRPDSQAEKEPEKNP